jgi:hypothetical protein
LNPKESLANYGSKFHPLSAIDLSLPQSIIELGYVNNTADLAALKLKGWTDAETAAFQMFEHLLFATRTNRHGRRIGLIPAREFSRGRRTILLLYANLRTNESFSAPLRLCVKKSVESA